MCLARPLELCIVMAILFQGVVFRNLCKFLFLIFDRLSQEEDDVGLRSQHDTIPTIQLAIWVVGLLAMWVSWNKFQKKIASKNFAVTPQHSPTLPCPSVSLLPGGAFGQASQPGWCRGWERLPRGQEGERLQWVQERQQGGGEAAFPSLTNWPPIVTFNKIWGKHGWWI